MIIVDRAHIGLMRPLFSPERPGPLAYGHVALTGHGTVEVDRWPDPQIAIARTGADAALRGDPERLSPDDLADVAAFIDAPPSWWRALQTASPSIATWERIIATLPMSVGLPVAEAALLGPADAAALADLPADLAWIHETWGGPDGLAEARVARGLYVGTALASVAVPFHVGFDFEDIGVVTVATHRGRGLATICGSALCHDIRRRGKTPSWSTSPDNLASLAVASTLGFIEDRRDVLYALNVAIPTEPNAPPTEP